MTKNLLRYPDLRARRIVNNRPTLARLIAKESFPTGFLIGPNSRAWDEAEIDAWLAQRAKTHIVKPRTPKRAKAAEVSRERA